MILPCIYSPLPKGSVTEVVCKNTQMPPNAKKTVNNRNRVDGFTNCSAAIQPFDNSSMPVKMIPMGRRNKLLNHVFKYVSKILNTITHPQTEIQADMLPEMTCVIDTLGAGGSFIFVNSGFGKRKPVKTAEMICMIQSISGIIGDANAAPAIPKIKAGPALLQ